MSEIITPGMLAEEGVELSLNLQPAEGVPPTERDDPVRPSEGVVRVKPYVPRANLLTTLALPVDSTWQRYAFDRPTILLPYDDGSIGARLDLRTFFAPEQPDNNHPIGGIVANRCRVYIPSAGIWWLRADAVGGPFAPQAYHVIDASDPTFANYVLNPKTQNVLYSVYSPAVATVETAFSLQAMIQATWLWVQNASANACQFTFGADIPSATNGINLSATDGGGGAGTGTPRFFPPGSLPVGAVRTFSTLGGGGANVVFALGVEAP